MRKSSAKLTAFAHTLLAIIFFSGLTSLVLIPPFQKLDEISHFYRVYQLSEGVMRGLKVDGGSGGYLPAQLTAKNPAFFDEMPLHPERRASFAAWTDRLHSSAPLTDSQDPPVFIRFTGTVLYSPLVYLPQLVGVWAGRVLAKNLYVCLYLGRLFALLASVALIYAAFCVLAETPAWQFILFSLAMLPTFLNGMSGLSADAMTIALPFLLAALWISLRRSWSRPRFYQFLAVAAALSLCKGVYGLLAATALPLIWSSSSSYRTRALRIAALVAAITIPAGLWALVTRAIYTPLEWIPDVDPKRQLAQMLNHPLVFLQIFWRCLASDTKPIFKALIGCFSWQLAGIPKGMIAAYSALVIATLGVRGAAATGAIGATSGDERSPRFLRDSPLRAEAGMIAFTFLFGIFFSGLLITAIYLSANSVGAPQIEGLQGRYWAPLIPIFFAPLPGLIHLDEARYRRFQKIVAGSLLLLTGAVAQLLLQNYWV